MPGKKKRRVSRKQRAAARRNIKKAQAARRAHHRAHDSRRAKRKSPKRRRKARDTVELPPGWGVHKKTGKSSRHAWRRGKKRKSSRKSKKSSRRKRKATHHAAPRRRSSSRSGGRRKSGRHKGAFRKGHRPYNKGKHRRRYPKRKSGYRKPGYTFSREKYALENPLSLGEGVIGGLTAVAGYVFSDIADRFAASHALTSNTDAQGNTTYIDPTDDGKGGGKYNSTLIAAPMNMKRWIVGLVIPAAFIGIGAAIKKPAGRSALQLFGFGALVRVGGKGLSDLFAYVSRKTSMGKRLYNTEQSAQQLTMSSYDTTTLHTGLGGGWVPPSKRLGMGASSCVKCGRQKTGMGDCSCMSACPMQPPLPPNPNPPLPPPQPPNPPPPPNPITSGMAGRHPAFLGQPPTSATHGLFNPKLSRAGRHIN